MLNILIQMYQIKDFKLGPIKNLEIHRGETIALVGPSDQENQLL